MGGDKSIQPAADSRRGRAASNAIVSIIGAAVILVALNYLGMRHYVRSDWTSAQIYTLSDKSEKVLGSISEEVQIYLLWSQGDPSGRYADVKEILSRYAAASSKLKVEVLDMDLNRERVQLILDRYGARVRQDEFGRQGIEAGVFVVSGENVQFVSSSEFEDVGGDMPGAPPEEENLSGFKAEQALTSAVLQVTSDNHPVVCFTQGHGEMVLEGFGGRALGHIKDGLVQDGYKVKAINTVGVSRVPDSCDIVAVVGPQSGFMEDEAALLQEYLKGGGRLLLLLDPVIEGNRFVQTGLERLTAQNGIKLSSDILFETDVKKLVSSSPLMFMASEFTPHGAVKQMSLPQGVVDQLGQERGSAYPVVFSMARSLSLKDGTDVVADVLARSSGESWGEVDLNSLGTGDTVPAKDQYDTPGPAAIAMAAVLPGKTPDDQSAGRLVVVGDSDFLLEELFVSAGLFNRDLWSGLVGWLTARSELISIAPKNPEHVRLSLTEDDMSFIWQIVISEVLFFVVLGVFVWMRRRS